MKYFLRETTISITVFMVVVVIMVGLFLVLPIFPVTADDFSSGYAWQVSDISAAPEGYDVVASDVTEWFVVGRHASSYQRSSSVYYVLELENEEGETKTANVSLEDFLEVEDGAEYYTWWYQLRSCHTYGERVKKSMKMAADEWPAFIIIGAVALVALVSIIVHAVWAIKGVL